MYNFEQENNPSVTVFSGESFLPFPQNLNVWWRSLISIMLVGILVKGLGLRLKIYSYIQNSETKLNAVNVLFFLDQLNGVFLAIVLAARISFSLLTIPASELMGPLACSCYEFITGMYISGSFVWRFNIAVIRVLYIKAQNWLTMKMGVNKLLAIMIITGLGKMILLSIFMVTSDSYSYAKKSCYRWSDEAQKIIGAYQVRNFQILIFFLTNHFSSLLSYFIVLTLFYNVNFEKWQIVVAQLKEQLTYNTKIKGCTLHWMKMLNFHLS